jgi:O-methyltransferase
MYRSTMNTFRSLYRRVSPSGYVIVDDYHSWDSCRRAVDDFCRETHIASNVTSIDQSGAYWQVEAQSNSRASSVSR